MGEVSDCRGLGRKPVHKAVLKTSVEGTVLRQVGRSSGGSQRKEQKLVLYVFGHKKNFELDPIVD